MATDGLKEFTKARSQLILTSPFFGTLALRLKPTQNVDIETARTDGECIEYNPKWFLKLREQERIGLIAHEVMHVALMHMLRRDHRDPVKWNVAGDYVINGALIKSKFILPHTELIDPQYDNMSTENVYALLPDDILNGTRPGDILLLEGDDPGGCGGVIDHPSISNGSAKGKFEAEIEVAIQQAAEVAKAMGKLPGHLQTLIEKALAPKIDWKMTLARFLRANNKSDFTWVKPNRRFVSRGLYLPSLHTPCLEEIAVAVDTSGSISEDELLQFTGEITSILHDTNPERIHFLQCDTEVRADDEYTRESLPLKITYQGRGGTSFSPVIDHITTEHPGVSALVYLTDLESNDFGNKPHYPVLWITTSSTEAPYGEVVQL
jgi:predicted metal-dependent peptidase